MSVNSESDPNVISFPRARQSEVRFNRPELEAILKIYGRAVAAGTWRDYAIDQLEDRAVFSVFRKASEVPLYRVEKNPGLAQRQGSYAVIAAGGYVMKRGQHLDAVLKALEKAVQ